LPGEFHHFLEKSVAYRKHLAGQMELFPHLRKDSTASRNRSGELTSRDKDPKGLVPLPFFSITSRTSPGLEAKDIVIWRIDYDFDFVRLTLREA